MNKQAVLDRLNEFGLNLYDAAIMDAEGIASRVYQPCSLGHNSYSVAKAFVMTAIGLLQDEGVLSVHDPMTKFFPEFGEKWQHVTLEHALTHTIGFADGFVDTDEDTAAFRVHHLGEDYLPLIAAQPLFYAPGTHYAYSDTAFYLLSRVVLTACGQPVDEYLRPRLMLPLGFETVAWTRCPMGCPMGATGLYVSAADMVKLPWLYMQGGVYEGKRILSKAWVRQALDGEYELKPLGETSLIGKGGMYCQKILFSRTGNFAAAWHAHNKGGADKPLVEYLSCL